MTRQAISEKLAELRQSDSGRSQTARLADLLPEIEATLASGVSRQAVLDQLNESGFNLALKGFETALARLRKRARAAGQPRPSPPHSASPALAPAASVPARLEDSEPAPAMAEPAPAERKNPEELKRQLEGYKPPADVFDTTTRPTIKKRT